ncbi:DNA-directed RNA polymerase subunit N [Saccharolobus caldissimus]|uniref:DNA-directed RNA polymerase subunit Rpo10 n=1 Tax=Saccharolobus caldissimus TaxID=1702097 RepID=A0AAQ4CWQ4_9CREN|nr:DNA-directed RNA polymerase subunit N [Saccharolobus caldissimus]BDC00236.1 DNA-directed RNA polymerase subunit N [Saccharolobus caldissimus]
MMIPIRCFTCGSLIADKWEPFIARVNAGEPPGKVLDELGVKRYCCRRMLLSHVDIINEIIHYTRPI